MLKVLKSGSINVKSAEQKTVAIPDAVIIRTEGEDASATPESLGIDLSVYRPEHMRILEDYFQERKKVLMASVNKEIDHIETESAQRLEESKRQALQIKEEAEKTASEIIKNAQIQAEKIMEDVRQEEIRIYAEAEARGFTEGQRKKSEEISNCFAELDSQMKHMKQLQNEQFEKIAPELKYFALDIAEKIVYKKIEEDDKYLYELVIRAMKELKEPEWITVEISDKMSGLVKYLEEQQKSGIISENAEFNSASSELGDITIESQAGVCDASVALQLKNIRSYFDNYGDDYELYSGTGKSEN